MKWIDGNLQDLTVDGVWLYRWAFANIELNCCIEHMQHRALIHCETFLIVKLIEASSLYDDEIGFIVKSREFFWGEW